MSKSIVNANSFNDHDLVGIVRKVHMKKCLPRKIFVHDHRKYDIDSFKNELRNTPWENCLAEPDVNTAWNLFKYYLTNAVDNHAPLIERKVRGKKTLG